MACGDCPPPRRSPRLEAALAVQEETLAQIRAIEIVLPPDPMEVLTKGTTILPASEPTLLLRVDITRLRSGYPPILIYTGTGFSKAYAATKVALLGPSVLGPVDPKMGFSMGLFTSAAVEIAE